MQTNQCYNECKTKVSNILFINTFQILYNIEFQFLSYLYISYILIKITDNNTIKRLYFLNIYRYYVNFFYLKTLLLYDLMIKIDFKKHAFI
jgi:hypothetical protein